MPRARWRGAWTITDVHNRLSDPCGGQRLPNGNTIICSYGQTDGAKPRIFEVTRDKKVVWEFFHPDFSHAHEVHVVTTNSKKCSRRCCARSRQRGEDTWSRGVASP